jgi:hypothetical protein
MEHLSTEDLSLISNSHLDKAHNDPLLGVPYNGRLRVLQDHLKSLKVGCFISIAANLQRFLTPVGESIYLVQYLCKSKMTLSKPALIQFLFVQPKNSETSFYNSTLVMMA